MKRALLSIIFICAAVFAGYAMKDSFLESLNLTEAQKKSIRLIMDAKELERETLMIHLQKKHLELKEYLLQETIDPERVKVLLSELSGIEAELRFSRFMIDYEIEKLLTPEQKKEFRQMRVRKHNMMKDKMGPSRKLWF